MTNTPEAAAIDSPETFAIIDSDETKMQRLFLWLEERGATCASVRVETGDGTRTICAGKPIQDGELLMHIPYSLMITSESAAASAAGQRIQASGVSVSSNAIMSAHLLDIRREGGFWQPYLDVLPKDFYDHPMCFTDAELGYLKGSYVLPLIQGQKVRVDSEYQRLLPSFGATAFTSEEFMWAQCIVMTRAHGVVLRQRQSMALVPLADLPNHAAQTNLDWGRESSLGFLYTANRKIEAGDPLCITYGHKCNGELFYVYGFCLEDNAHNLAKIDVPGLLAAHPFFKHTEQLGSYDNGARAFKVPAGCDAPAARAMLTYLRYSFLEDFPGAEGMEAGEDKKDDLPPVSRANEAAVMTTLAAACRRRLQQFDTGIEQDEALLRGDSLPQKLRYAVMVRHGEKVILKYFLDLAKAALTVLLDSSRDPAAPALPDARFAGYFAELARHLGADLQ